MLGGHSTICVLVPPRHCRGQQDTGKPPSSPSHPAHRQGCADDLKTSALVDQGFLLRKQRCACALAAMSLRSRLNCYSCGTTGPKEIDGRNCRLTRCIGAECFAELTQPYVVVDGESRPPPVLERFDKERCSKPGCGRCASLWTARSALSKAFCSLSAKTRLHHVIARTEQTAWACSAWTSCLGLPLTC